MLKILIVDVHLESKSYNTALTITAKHHLTILGQKVVFLEAHPF